MRGRHQITSFKLAGELLGLDGIGTDHHCVEAVALDAALVSIIPYTALTDLLQENAAFRKAFNKVMGHEIVRDQAMMLLLGTTVAEQRVAAFVIDMAGRLPAHGRPASLLLLCMSRHDIGSYLGLILETVSRILSRLRGVGRPVPQHAEHEHRADGGGDDAYWQFLGGEQQAAGDVASKQQHSADERCERQAVAV